MGIKNPVYGEEGYGKIRSHDKTLEEPIDSQSSDLIALRNPGMPRSKSIKKVYPIEFIGDFFIYLNTMERATDRAIIASYYAVAHTERGITIWAGFGGIEHAREFLNYIKETKLSSEFLHARQRHKIKAKLVEMGYTPIN